MKPPCSGRAELFEPFQRPDEDTPSRGYRLNLAAEVCKLCPIATRSACLLQGQEQPLGRGVWGGQILTELSKPGRSE